VLGYGVKADQAWPEVLKNELAGGSVINLGLSGAGPQQYRRIYESFGRGLRPRLIVIGIFVANDFADAEMFENWLASGIGGNYLEWREFGRGTKGHGLLRPFTNLWNVARGHSYVYSLVRVTWNRLRKSATDEYALHWTENVTLQLDPGDPVEQARLADPGRSRVSCRA
jgi:hypothetical protein